MSKRLASKGKPAPPTFEQAGGKTEEEKDTNQSTEVSTNLSTNKDTNKDTDTNTNNDTEDSIVSIIKGITEVPKPIKKKQVSVYLDEDIAKEFDKFANKHGKGAKSELINEFLKKALGIKR